MFAIRYTSRIMWVKLYSEAIPRWVYIVLKKIYKPHIGLLMTQYHRGPNYNGHVYKLQKI